AKAAVPLGAVAINVRVKPAPVMSGDALNVRAHGYDPVHVWSEHKSSYTRKGNVRVLKCLPEDLSVEFRDDEAQFLQPFQLSKSL
ncbi:MAG: hypothetical protein Q9212_006277, partial [Teloschistes hypoglaucus]